MKTASLFSFLMLLTAPFLQPTLSAQTQRFDNPIAEKRADPGYTRPMTGRII